MGLSEREKQICNILLKGKDQSINDAQHVRIDEILNFS
jgi:hypothetical protein